MMLRPTPRHGFLLQVSPDELLVLAEACDHAADATMEGEAGAGAHRTNSFIFHLLGAHLTALALVIDAPAHMHGQDRDEFTETHLRAAWGVLLNRRGQLCV